MYICGSISVCVCVHVQCMCVCVCVCVSDQLDHSSPPQKVKQQEKQLVTQQVGKVKGYNSPCHYQS